MSRTNYKVFGVKDIKPALFVRFFAKHLKNSAVLEVPQWADLIKTGVHKQLSPYDPDWYFVRAGKKRLLALWLVVRRMKYCVCLRDLQP